MGIHVMPGSVAGEPTTTLADASLSQEGLIRHGEVGRGSLETDHRWAWDVQSLGHPAWPAGGSADAKLPTAFQLGQEPTPLFVKEQIIPNEVSGKGGETKGGRD